MMELRYAFRSVRRNPSFALVVFFITAVSIGACSGIYSLLYVMILKPLTFPEADQVVHVGPSPPATADNYRDWLGPSQSLESIGGYKRASFYLRVGDERMMMPGLYMTSGMFSVWKVRPILGNAFTSADDVAGAAPVVVLSYQMWKEYFQGDPHIIGRAIHLDHVSLNVVGIMPKDFVFFGYLWVSMGQFRLRPGLSNKIFLLGRLQGGATQQQAAAEYSSLAMGIQGSSAEKVEIERYIADAGLEYRQPLLVLLSATLVVLLIACLNIGNLLLMRAVSRRKEIAIHMALGATKSSLFRRSFLELAILFVPAGLVGLWLGIQGVHAIREMLPFSLDRFRPVMFNAPLVLFAAVLALIAAAICSFASQLRLQKQQLGEYLKEGGYFSRSTEYGARFRPYAVVLQIALGMMLLTGAGLLLRSLIHLYHVNPGFDTSNVLTAHITLGTDKYPDEERWRNAYRQMLLSLKSQPGVQSAAITTNLPLYGASATEMFRWKGKSIDAQLKEVSPEYFAVLRLRLLAGRYFAETDTAQNQPVVIVNESMANRIGRNSVLGEAITFGEEPAHVVVGVVADVKHAGLDRAPEPEVYACAWQHTWRWGNLLVRTADAPMRHEKTFLNAVWSVDPDQPVIFLTTMENILTESTRDRQFVLYLLSLFGVIALLLLLFGVYAVFNYSVAERAHELGIRIALGAAAGDIFALLYRQGAWLLLLGILLGLALAANTHGLLRSYLFGVQIFDPVTILLVAAGIAASGCIAILFPVLRALRSNPLSILRAE